MDEMQGLGNLGKTHCCSSVRMVCKLMQMREHFNHGNLASLHPKAFDGVARMPLIECW